MPATLTPIAWLLRAGPEHHSVKHRDPYTASGVVRLTDETAEVIGVCGTMQIADIREALEQIKLETGARYVVWERANGKKIRV